MRYSSGGRAAHPHGRVCDRAATVREGNRWHVPVERAAFNLNLNLMPRDIQSMYSRDCTWQGPLRAVPAHLHNF